MSRRRESTAGTGVPTGWTLRRARWSELDAITAYEILRLRSRVFVLEQDCVYEDPDGRDLESGARHLWLEDGDGSIGAYLRVLTEGAAVRLGRIVTDPRHRSGGLAARLISEALGDHGDGPVVLDAQLHLRAWYERFGFAADGEPFDEDGIMHLPMRRDGR
ncbi:MAG: GNAT family N-acetyltransferase [Actinomycetota bacterium]|nr:GNAT family N-acetyltransferase [Actinomycetota bacterium]